MLPFWAHFARPLWEHCVCPSISYHYALAEVIKKKLKRSVALIFLWPTWCIFLKFQGNIISDPLLVSFQFAVSV